HKYINPNASQRNLIYASYASSALLIALGIAIGFAAKSINQMFTWIMGTLGAGVLMPNVLRWYWWRMNGWGYAAGAISGMALSLIQAFLPKFAAMPLYITFPAIVLIVLGITITVTLFTEPTDEKTLRKFYTEVRPAGWWGPVAKDLTAAGKPRKPFAQDFANVLIGIPWLIAMWMCPIYLVLHRNIEALIAAGIVAVSSLVLWQTWYRKLEED
ncbi:MAG: sodium:solute symporter, partial [Armatimonadota bacterium]|nr:sodium:solute symporter [Armatimonadota bacterium]